MHLNCPHCQNPFEVVEADRFKEILCPSCGSSFSLNDLATRTYAGPKPPMAKVGRFELTEPLGEGAFGSVWRAKDPDLGRLVAVKVPRPGVMGGAEFEERFLREARAAANLKHEGIVTVHEVGRQNGSIYIVSDLIDGVNLAEWLTGQPRALTGPEEQARFRHTAELMVQIANAVDHAHRHGVVHRDLKPSNIMLDRAGKPHIMDFGLAKREAAEVAITRDGRFLGTPAYMSPEQARGQSHEADARSDLWSLGVMLYEMLARERPFRGAERMILHQILQDEPRPPRRLNDAIPRDLETITLKCLAKEPARRYQSAAELGDELRRWLRGEPIVARRISQAERLWRWAKRNPRVAALSAAVFTLLATIALGSTVAVVVINNARGQAVAASKAERAQRQLAETRRQEAEQARESETEAKNEAVTKQQEAEKARDETEKVSRVFDYVVASFRKPDPSADGEKLTVAELFGQAVEQLETKFPNQPLIQAQLLNAIGQTFYGLGLYQKAVAVHERARDLRRNELGEDHEDTLTSMNELAVAYQYAGRMADALPLYEQTLELTKARLGLEHSDTLSSMNNLAGAYRSAGRLAEALPLIEESLDLTKAQVGPEHPDTLNLTNNLAETYISAGRTAEALPLLEQTLELMKAQLGQQHPDTLKLMNNLALAYNSAGRLAEALPLFEQTLELRRAKLGPEHPDTLASMSGLAAAYESAGRLAEALPLKEQTLELRKATLGPEHPSTLTSMNNLAGAYESAGRLAEALPLYEQTLELKKAKLGPEHPTTLRSMNNLAGAYESAGRLAEAVPLYEQTLELLKAKLGPEHPDTLGSMGNLANAYLVGEQPEKALPLFDQFIAGNRRRATPDDPNFAGLLAAVSLELLQYRQYPAAETYLRECLTIREKKLPDDWVLFNTKSMLGGALAGQKKFQEAEPLLVEGYSGMKDREAKSPPAAKARLPEAIQRLIELYTAWEKPEEAEKWQKELDSRKEPEN